MDEFAPFFRDKKMKKDRNFVRRYWRKSLLCCLLGHFVPSIAIADPTTTYEYDARGRLIKVLDDAGKSSTYVLDSANNRVSVSDQTASALAPSITSFSAPSSVDNVGDSATISWTSKDTTYCAIKIFGDYSTYPSLPTNGSVNVSIYENTGITLTCYYSSLSASKGKIIRVLNGVLN